MKRPVVCRTLLFLALASLLTPPAWAKRDLTELSLEDLLNVTVVGAATSWMPAASSVSPWKATSCASTLT